jgi:hypothetical protein
MAFYDSDGDDTLDDIPMNERPVVDLCEESAQRWPLTRFSTVLADMHTSKGVRGVHRVYMYEDTTEDLASGAIAHNEVALSRVDRDGQRISLLTRNKTPKLLQLKQLWWTCVAMLRAAATPTAASADSSAAARQAVVGSQVFEVFYEVVYGDIEKIAAHEAEAKCQKRAAKWSAKNIDYETDPARKARLHELRSDTYADALERCKDEASAGRDPVVAFRYWVVIFDPNYNLDTYLQKIIKQNELDAAEFGNMSVGLGGSAGVDGGGGGGDDDDGGGGGGGRGGRGGGGGAQKQRRAGGAGGAQKQRARANDSRTSAQRAEAARHEHYRQVTTVSHWMDLCNVYLRAAFIEEADITSHMLGSERAPFSMRNIFNPRTTIAFSDILAVDAQLAVPLYLRDPPPPPPLNADADLGHQPGRAAAEEGGAVLAARPAAAAAPPPLSIFSFPFPARVLRVSWMLLTSRVMCSMLLLTYQMRSTHPIFEIGGTDTETIGVMACAMMRVGIDVSDREVAAIANRLDIERGDRMRRARAVTTRVIENKRRAAQRLGAADATLSNGLPLDTFVEMMTRRAYESDNVSAASSSSSASAAADAAGLSTADDPDGTLSRMYGAQNTRIDGLVEKNSVVLRYLQRDLEMRVARHNDRLAELRRRAAQLDAYALLTGECAEVYARLTRSGTAGGDALAQCALISWRMPTRAMDDVRALLRRNSPAAVATGNDDTVREIFERSLAARHTPMDAMAELPRRSFIMWRVVMAHLNERLDTQHPIVASVAARVVAQAPLAGACPMDSARTMTYQGVGEALRDERRACAAEMRRVRDEDFPREILMSRAQHHIHKQHQAYALKPHRSAVGNIGRIPGIVHEYRREHRIYKLARPSVVKFDARLSVFSQYVIREAQLANVVVDLTDANYVAWMVLMHMQYDTSRYQRNMHMNFIETGTMAVGKSYKTDWIKSMRIPGTVVVLTRQTTMSNSVKGDRDGALVHFDEAPANLFIDDDKRSAGQNKGEEAMFKQMLTNCMCQTQAMTFHPVTGERVQYIATFRCIQCFMVSTNSALSQMSAALASRFHRSNVGEQTKHASGTINERQLSRAMSVLGAAATAESTSKDDYMRQKRRVQVLFQDIDHLFAVGALTEPSAQGAAVIIAAVAHELEARDYPKMSTRWIIRVQLMARIFAIIEHIYEHFFVLSAPYHGRPIKFAYLLTLDQRLCVWAHHVIYAITLMSDQIVPREERLIHDGLRAFLAQSLASGIVPWGLVAGSAAAASASSASAASDDGGSLSRSSSEMRSMSSSSSSAPLTPLSVDFYAPIDAFRRAPKHLRVAAAAAAAAAPTSASASPAATAAALLAQHAPRSTETHSYVSFKLGENGSFAQAATQIQNEIKALESYKIVPSTDTIGLVLDQTLGKLMLPMREYKLVSREEYATLSAAAPLEYPAKNINDALHLVPDLDTPLKPRPVIIRKTGYVEVSVGYILKQSSMASGIEDAIKAVFNHSHQLPEIVVLGSMRADAPDTPQTMRLTPYWRLPEGVDARTAEDTDWLPITERAERLALDAQLGLTPLSVPRATALTVAAQTIVFGAATSATSAAHAAFFGASSERDDSAYYAQMNVDDSNGGGDLDGNGGGDDIADFDGERFNESAPSAFNLLNNESSTASLNIDTDVNTFTLRCRRRQLFLSSTHPLTHAAVMEARRRPLLSTGGTIADAESPAGALAVTLELPPQSVVPPPVYPGVAYVLGKPVHAASAAAASYDASAAAMVDAANGGGGGGGAGGGGGVVVQVQDGGGFGDDDAVGFDAVDAFAPPLDAAEAARVRKQERIERSLPHALSTEQGIALQEPMRRWRAIVKTIADSKRERAERLLVRERAHGTENLDFCEEHYLTYAYNTKVLAPETRRPHWEWLGMTRAQYEEMRYHPWIVNDLENRMPMPHGTFQFSFPGDLVNRRTHAELFENQKWQDGASHAEMQRRAPQSLATCDPATYAVTGQYRAEPIYEAAIAVLDAVGANYGLTSAPMQSQVIRPRASSVGSLRPTLSDADTQQRRSAQADALALAVRARPTAAAAAAARSSTTTTTATMQNDSDTEED